MTNDVIEHITLELKREKYKHTISAKKNDTNVRRVQAIITDNGAIVELDLVAMAVVKAIKPDGTHIYNDCTISGNTIWFVMTQQMIAAAGDVTCEIEITWADNTMVSTPTFTIHVYDTVQTGVESTNEYNGIVQALVRSENAATTATNKASQAEQSATNADAYQLKAEGFALGTQNGVEVSSDSEYYENNAKYYNEEMARQIAELEDHVYTKDEIDAMVSDIDNEIDAKQDILIEGDGISINENVISSSVNASISGEILTLL